MSDKNNQKKQKRSNKLVDYNFERYQWAPPRSRRDPKAYLFGFDEDNQPYIVKWDNTKDAEGWVAVTISDYKYGAGAATPREYKGDTVDKLLSSWADAPALYRTMMKVEEENRRKNKERDYD